MWSFRYNKQKIGKNNTKECRTFLAYFLDLYDCKEKDEGILAHSWIFAHSVCSYEHIYFLRVDYQHFLWLSKSELQIRDALCHFLEIEMLNVCERQDSLRYAVLSLRYLMLMTLINKSYNWLIIRVLNINYIWNNTKQVSSFM